MSLKNFVRVHNAPLSLWQSFVSEFAHRELELLTDSVSHKEVLQHHLVAATALHVKLVQLGNPPKPETLDLSNTLHQEALLSHIAYQKALCLVDGDIDRAALLDDEYRRYSDKDPGFLTCATTYAEYYVWYKGEFLYNDWKELGEDISTYSVINENNDGNGFAIPNDGKVAIIGDWGTGLDDALLLLVDILKNHKPAAIIHLGDIYYAGTPYDCAYHFTDIITNAFTLAGVSPIPVFTIPGNHDYYSLGYGFYPMLLSLNSAVGDAALQPASYFCLRTEDGGWQLLGMDTGFGDSNPADQVNPMYSGPAVQANEVLWHQDKLTNFAGSTILLSHHQVFSSNNTINGKDSRYSALPDVNPYLFQAFSPYFNKIAAWLWGHEHNFVMYKNNLMGLAKGRLLGCSAFEELTSDNPYKIVYPDIVNFMDPDTHKPVHLTTSADKNGTTYYNHAYAIIDFSGRENPTDDVTAYYYQYPSWGDNPPPNPQATLLYSEPYVYPAATYDYSAVNYNTNISIRSGDGPYIGFTSTRPDLSISSPDTLQITPVGDPGSTQVRHGDVVRLMTTNGSQYIGGSSFETRLFYTDVNDSTTAWYIYKKDTTDSLNICHNDEIYFVSKYWDQWLIPYDSLLFSSIYLTTRNDVEFYFTIVQPLCNIIENVPVTRKEDPYKKKHVSFINITQ